MRRQNMFYGYARISTKKQKDTSIEVQLEYLRREAKNLGEDFTAVSEKVSGAEFEKRSEFIKIINDSVRGDIIGVYDTSRFGRETGSNLDYLEKIHKKGVRFFNGLKFVDFDNPEDKMMFTVSSAFATYQRDIQTKKSKASTTVSRENGNMTLRGDFFGYTMVKEKGVPKVSINERQAHYIRYIFEESVKGKSVYTLADELKDVTFEDSKVKLNDIFIRRLLFKPIYMGYYTKRPWKQIFVGYQGRTEINTVTPISHAQLEKELVKSNLYEPIVSPELWWRCFDNLRTTTRTHATQFEYRTTPYELTGILRCPYCKAGYVHNFVKKKDIHEVYQISTHVKGCEHRFFTSIRKNVAEFIMRATFFLTFLDAIHVGKLLNERKALLTEGISELKKQEEEVAKRIQEYEKQIDSLIDDATRPNVSEKIKERLYKKADDFQTEVEKLQSSLNSTSIAIREKECEFDELLKEESENVMETFIHQNEEGRRNLYAKYCYATYEKGKLNISYNNGKRFEITTHSCYRKDDKKNFPFKMYYHDELEATGSLNPALYTLKFDPIEDEDMFTQSYNKAMDKLAEQALQYTKEAYNNTIELPRKTLERNEQKNKPIN